MKVIADDIKTIDFRNSVRVEIPIGDIEVHGRDKFLNITITDEGVIYDIVVAGEIEKTQCSTFIEISENIR